MLYENIKRTYHLFLVILKYQLIFFQPLVMFLLHYQNWIKNNNKMQCDPLNFVETLNGS